MGLYIGKIFVSYYGLMILVGIIVGFALSIPLLRKYHICLDDYLIIISIISLSCMIGSKILYWIINFKEMLFLFNNFSIENIKYFTNSGFVFYGGLLLSLVAIQIIDKTKITEIKKILNIIFPIFVIAHGFGRIGCGLVGCCYGIRYEKIFSIRYINSIIAPNNIGLFPTQYIEALFQILIGSFFYILILVYGTKDKYIIQYLILYSVIRFILEFLRGDEKRGFLGVLSISQVISLLLIVVIISNFIINKLILIHKKEK